MQQQGASLGAGGHLNGAPQTPMIARPARERRQHLRQPLGAGDGVELVARLGEAGRRIEVVVGAERHDEHVGLVDSRVRGHAARFGIDRRDRLLEEAHARLHDVSVREPNGVGRRPPEHDVELRVAEDERVVLVDQRDLELVAEGLGQRRRELEPAEARAEDQDSLHRSILVARQKHYPVVPSVEYCSLSDARVTT